MSKYKPWRCGGPHAGTWWKHRSIPLKMRIYEGGQVPWRLDET